MCHLRFLLSLSILLTAVPVVQAQSALIISQYVETDAGTTPKGIELWNVSGTTIDFSSDVLKVLQGTNGQPLDSIFAVQTGSLGPGEVLVIGTADIGTYLAANGLGSVRFEQKSFVFNGDDALQIQLGGNVEDTFGTPEVDPGTAWSGNGVSTANQNIALLDGIMAGDVDGFTDPSERFETISTNPSGPGGLSGFGLAPGETPVATVRFGDDAETITEGDTYDLVVELVNANNGESATVTVSTTCSAGDVTPTSQQVALDQKTPSQIITLTATEDAVEEGTEACTYDLTIDSQSGSVEEGSPNTFTLTINDDDAPPLPDNALVITEFMADPASVADTAGEWFEVFNNTASVIDLMGYVIRDAGSNTHTIASSVEVPAGGFAVLCANSDPALNGGVTCDYDYSSFMLTNTTDEIIVEDDLGGLVDSLQYTASWVTAGTSTVYVGSPNGDNTVRGNWVDSISREAGFDDSTPLGDDGSPGTNGVHGNLASPFGVGIADYCYAEGSGDWNSAATWSNCSGGVPGAGDAAGILNGSVVTAAMGTVAAAVVVVEAGGELVLQVAATADVVTVAGALTVAGSGSLLVGTDLSVSGTLTSNNAVTLQANADNTGRIASLTNEFGTVNGNLTAARGYVDDAGGKGAGSFRGIFPPLAGVTFDQLNDDFQTQGAAGSDFPSAQPNLYRFDAPTQQFIAITDFSGAFDPDSGYVFYMFDFDIPATWDVTGTVREEYTLDLVYNDDGDSQNPNNDFNWVPQPFAGPIDFRELYLSTTPADSLNATLYVLDPETEEFRTYNAVTQMGVDPSMGGAGRYVAPFQSFVVQTVGSDVTLDYQYETKDTGETPLLVGRGNFGRGLEEVASHVQLRLEGQAEAEGLGSTQTYLVFYPEGAEGYDPGDAGLLYPFSSAFATLVLTDETGRELSMDARDLALTTETFHARVATTEPGTYTVSWPVFHEIPGDWELVLSDTETGAEVDLRDQSSYTFSITGPTAERRGEALEALRPAQRDGASRFLITVSGPMTAGDPTGARPAEFSLEGAYPNPFVTTATVRYALPRAADVRVTVYDLLGREVATLVEGLREAGRHTATVSGRGLAGGVYLVRMTTDGFAETKKIVLLN